MDDIAILHAQSLLSEQGITHGFFTRHGGVSEGLYSTLNCSHGSKDSTENVTENRRRAMNALGLSDATLYGVLQIHSNTVHHIKAGMDTAYQRGDALVTSDPGVALSVLGADCAPILFADSQNNVIAATHSGWKGALSGVIQSTVESMVRLGANKQSIKAAIGPAIAQCSYEVKSDFIEQLNNGSAIDVENFILSDDLKFYFDLPAFIQSQLLLAGVDAVELIKSDTYVEDRFFSYRQSIHADDSDYGRQISIISLTR